MTENQKKQYRKVEKVKDKMVAFRVNADDYELLKLCATVTGQTRPSGEPNVGEYIRFVLRMSLVPMKVELKKRGVTAYEAFESVRTGDGLVQFGGVPFSRS